MSDLYRRSIAAAEALRLYGVTLARDVEDAERETHVEDVAIRQEEARGELQLLAEARRAAGLESRPVEGMATYVAGPLLYEVADDLAAMEGLCRAYAEEAVDERVTEPQEAP